MSDAEKCQIIGHAHIALKLARSNAAAIKVRLLQYGKNLEETGQQVRLFVEDPTYKNPHAHILRSENLKAGLPLRSEEIAGLIDDLVKETNAIRELQEQINQF